MSKISVRETPLTERDRRFVQYAAQGMKLEDAMMRAGEETGRPLARSGASSVATRALYKANVRKELQAAAKKYGLRAETAVRTIAEAYRAKDPDGRRDHRTRLMAVDRHARLLDLYPDPPGAQAAEAGGGSHYQTNIAVLGSQPVEIVQFIAQTGRPPTEAERAKILESNLVNPTSTESTDSND